MNKTQALDIGGTPHLLRFTSMSAYLLQKELSMSLDIIATKISRNELGLIELQVLLYTELEGHRQNDPTSARIPWTLASALRLIDDEEDMGDFWARATPVVMSVFMAAFPKTITKAAEAALRRRERPTVGSASGTDGSTSTHSSSPQPKSESPNASSGVSTSTSTSDA